MYLPGGLYGLRATQQYMTGFGQDASNKAQGKAGTELDERFTRGVGGMVRCFLTTIDWKRTAEDSPFEHKYGSGLVIRRRLGCTGVASCRMPNIIKHMSTREEVTPGIPRGTKSRALDLAL